MMRHVAGWKAMKALRLLLFPLLVSALFVGWSVAPPAADAVSLMVSLDTSGLPAGARLAFDLIGGDDGVGNNSATISGFLPAASLVGGPSCDPVAACTMGSLDTAIVLTDTEFFNTLLQEIAPGGLISFKIDATTNLDLMNAGFPDSLSLSIVDGAGDPLVSTDLFDTVLFVLDLDGTPRGSLSVAGSTEPAVSLAVGPAVAIPGPAGLLLVGLALPVILRGAIRRS